MSIEEWRDIPGWDGRAQVSSLGRIRVRRNGATPVLDGHWYVRKLNANTNYLSCCLPRRPGDVRQRTVYLHRLVAEVFLGPRPENAVVRHGPKGHRVNSMDNLSYGTPQQNAADDVERAVRRGMNNGRAKLTEREVKAIKRLLAHGLGPATLGRAFDISPAAIEFIRDGRNWRHVTI